MGGYNYPDVGPPCWSWVDTYRSQIFIRIVEILGLIVTLVMVVFGNPACYSATDLNYNNCTNAGTIWPTNWYENEQLYGQYFVLVATLCAIIGFILQIIFYSLLKKWKKTTCYMVSVFALIVIVISLALEIWYASGIKTSNHTIYVGSYIGASVFYGIMLIFPIIDIWVTKSDALFRRPKRRIMIYF